jgi:hypothetical protein
MLSSQLSRDFRMNVSAPYYLALHFYAAWMPHIVKLADARSDLPALLAASYCTSKPVKPWNNSKLDRHAPHHSFAACCCSQQECEA